jgi:hypothetical protein
MDARGFRLTSRLIGAMTLGYFVNLLSEASSNSRNFLELPARLGWWIALAPIGVAMLIYDLFSELRLDRKVLSAEREAHRKSLARIVAANDYIVSSVLDMLRKSPHSSNFNIHLFYREMIGDRVALVKERRLVHETEHFPANYALDHAFPDTDELVICEAFNSDEIRYEELPTDHPSRYNERIRGKVDPQISWVLACPMHVEHEQPAGVICAFGENRTFSDPLVRRVFESLLAAAGGVLSTSRGLISAECHDLDDFRITPARTRGEDSGIPDA